MFGHLWFFTAPVCPEQFLSLADTCEALPISQPLLTYQDRDEGFILLLTSPNPTIAKDQPWMGEG